MAKITKDEVLKIAKLSALELAADEVDGLVQQLQDVLTYAERVQQFASQAHTPDIKNVNVFRADTATQGNPAAILAQAPEHDSQFFVVPAVIDND